MSARTVLSVLGFLCTMAPALGAQAGLVVTVLDSLSHAPIYGASVRSVRLRVTERTDGLGRARFVQLARPDTLLIAAIGFAPETVTINELEREFRLLMARRAVSVAELRVSGRTGDAPEPALSGEWLLPRRVVGAIPPAVEADPLRALSIVPSVSFSTPLSARPLIRGYDAAESVVRIDGYDVLNPYHIGRIFSAFPADATESIAVAPVPVRGADGGTLVGVVDLRGRSGGEPGESKGIEVSPVSVTGWWGGGERTRVFSAVRAAWLGPATRLVGDGVPYEFQDLYIQAGVPLGTARGMRWSAFASRDELGDPGAGLGARWSTVLLGQRGRLVDGPRGSLDVIGSMNRFALDATDIQVRNSRIDVDNRFSRTAGGIEAEIRGPVVFHAGGSLGRRRIENSVTVRLGDDFVPAARTTALTEYQAYVEGRLVRRTWMLDLGARLDASPTARAFQPRARVAWTFGDRLTAAVAVARAARLYQLVTDPQPEPTVAFYDFWLNAGEVGVPTPRITHGAAELDGAWGQWAAHVGMFLSRGQGLGELRPVSDQRSGQTPFRYGASRTVGAELRGAWRHHKEKLGAVLGYTWSSSQRRWDDGAWRAWRLDRRHAVRLQLEGRLAGRWYLFGLGEFLSGQPISPVQELVWRDPRRLPGDTITELIPRYRYGVEGGARSAPTWHFDLGAQARFAGPGRSVISVGLSVINLTFGQVAPEAPVRPEELLREDGTFSPTGVIYKRLFDLPAVPSITARIEF
jgi:hypothetical protein